MIGLINISLLYIIFDHFENKKNNLMNIVYSISIIYFIYLFSFLLFGFVYKNLKFLILITLIFSVLKISNSKILKKALSVFVVLYVIYFIYSQTITATTTTDSIAYFYFESIYSKAKINNLFLDNRSLTLYILISVFDDPIIKPIDFLIPFLNFKILFLVLIQFKMHIKNTFVYIFLMVSPVLIFNLNYTNSHFLTGVFTYIVYEQISNNKLEKKYEYLKLLSLFSFLYFLRIEGLIIVAVLIGWKKVMNKNENNKDTLVLYVLSIILYCFVWLRILNISPIENSNWGVRHFSTILIYALFSLQAIFLVGILKKLIKYNTIFKIVYFLIGVIFLFAQFNFLNYNGKYINNEYSFWGVTLLVFAYMLFVERNRKNSENFLVLLLISIWFGFVLIIFVNNNYLDLFNVNWKFVSNSSNICARQDIASFCNRSLVQYVIPSFLILLNKIQNNLE